MTKPTTTETSPKSASYFYYVRMPEATFHELFDSVELRRKHNTWKPEYTGEKPIACVCVSYFKELGLYSRGLAICSLKDSFTKRLGRLKAAALANSFKQATMLPSSISAQANSKELKTLIDFIEDDTGLNLWTNNKRKRYLKARFGFDYNMLSPFEQRLLRNTIPESTPPPGRTVHCENGVCTFS